MTELVHLELATVALLELDAPPLNLVTGELLRELDTALARLEDADPGDVRAVVVTGRGERAFSVGSNVKEFEDHRRSGGRTRFELEARVAQRLAGLPMPTIAAIEGSALGGGLCAATSALHRSVRSSGCRRSAWRSLPAPVGPSGCLGSWGWHGPRSCC